MIDVPGPDNTDEHGLVVLATEANMTSPTARNGDLAVIPNDLDKIAKAIRYAMRRGSSP